MRWKPCISRQKVKAPGRLGLFLLFMFTMGGVFFSSGNFSLSGEDLSTRRTFELPQDSMFFRPGTGQNLANTYCLICHSADYVYTQPLHSQEKWRSVVLKMKHTFGCPIPDEKISIVAAYLFEQNQFNSGVQEP